MQSIWRGSVVVMLAIAFGTVAAAQKVAKKEVSRPPIAAFIGLDLKTLDGTEEEELTKLLSKSLAEEYLHTDLFTGYRPWHIWEVNPPKNKVNFILFQAHNDPMVPGGSSAAIHQFDSAGVLLESTQFGTGWRIFIDSAQWRYEPVLKGHVIDVKLHGTQYIKREIYGLIDGRVALLRLEDEAGKVTWNKSAPNQHAGPSVPISTEQECEAALASRDPMVVLETLTWLWAENGGVFRAPGKDPKLITSYFWLAEQTGVRKKLKELTKSKNPWINELANLCLGPRPASREWALREIENKERLERKKEKR